MTPDDFLLLLDYTSKGYCGYSVDKTTFNMLRQLNIFKGLVFSNILDPEIYEVWVCHTNYEGLSKVGLITEDDLAVDLAFIYEYSFLFCKSVKKSGELIEKLQNLYLPVFKPLNEINKFNFHKKVVDNIGKIVDTHA